MFRNYIKVAWRNLWRNKSYTFINILGLSSGIACAILIFTLVSYQFSFDMFHPAADRVFRVVTEYHTDGTEYQPGVPQPLGKAFRNDFSFMEKSARVFTFNNALISLPGEKEVKKFQEDNGVAYAEPEFFEIFRFPLVSGDHNAALTQPNTALITQKIATKYFGVEDPVGRIIRYNNQTNFRVTGVLRDIPGNTDRINEIYLSYANLKDRDAYMASDSSWGSVSSRMNFFVRLKPGITAAGVERQLPSFVKKYYGGDDATSTRLHLQPLSDVHFNADYDGPASRRNLYVLSLIGAFLVVTACVNFINLATAKALNRAKEVGVRKVMGSLRSHLFWQFMIETALIVFMSFALAYGLASLTLPLLNNLLRTRMPLDLLGDPSILLFLPLLLLAVIFLAGSYPGLILARFRPIAALKGKLSQQHIGGFSLRRILVITQFTVSQMLIIALIVIAIQIRYSRTIDLGFRKDGIVMLPVPENDKIKMTTLRSRLTAIAGTQDVTLCSQAPAAESNSYTNLRYDNRPKDEPWEVNEKFGDVRYLTTFNLDLIAGRNIFPSDTLREALVNEVFMSKVGVRDPAALLGKTIKVDGRKGIAIVGVIRDFHNKSLRSGIDPVVILPEKTNYYNCFARINLADIGAILSSYEKIWNQTYPDYVYSHQFLDERIERFYRDDTTAFALVEGFAGIAILISCLGLYGLVSFMAVQKTKEIGVRKVLGARVDNILWLFGKEFSQLLLFAFFIAAPVAGWVMHNWLQDFQYHIPLSWRVFALAILATFLIAALTVAWRSAKAALANPVNSLRSE
ncbi:MAG TPA: ABC transporter permease [Puia sp.]|nr:ABC transporter permease [Puia sp.]